MYPLKLFILLFIFVCELLVETLEMDFVNHKSKVNKSQTYVHERLLLPIGRSRKLPPLTRNGITLSINNYPIVLVLLEKKKKKNQSTNTHNKRDKDRKVGLLLQLMMLAIVAVVKILK
jgi:hypothetical protein